MGFLGRFMAGLSGFRRAYLNADTQQAQSASASFDAFSQYPARQLRNSLYWGLYQNNALWDDINSQQSRQIKTAFGLYAYTRHVFNPVYRVVEFGATHIIGGRLDPAAGDGNAVKSALPIEGASDPVRMALSRLWRDSSWQIEKDVWTRQGVCMGDAPLMVRDDPATGRVRLDTVHPGHVKWYQKGDDGRVSAYILEETRYNPNHLSVPGVNPSVDPRSLMIPCTYNEEAWIEPDGVHYKTFMNFGPFDWRLHPDGKVWGTRPGSEPEWVVPYGFIPLVMTQHIPIGLPFGMAEPHAALSKIFESDDVGSNIGDYVRRVLNGTVVIVGAKAPGKGAAEPSATGNDATSGNPQAGRTEANIMYLPVGGDVKHMLAPLDVEAVGKHVDRLREELKEDYPELRYYEMSEAGDVSGRALRVARQATESKVQTRRAGYDAGLALAQKIALAIASIRGYDGYAGLGAESPDDAAVDHSIGHRPVFSPDPLDDIEEGTAFWTMAGAAVNAGMPLEVFLEREGWPAEDIARMTAGKAASDGAALASIRTKQRLAMADTGIGGTQ